MNESYMGKCTNPSQPNLSQSNKAPINEWWERSGVNLSCCTRGNIKVGRMVKVYDGVQDEIGEREIKRGIQFYWIIIDKK